MTARIYKPAKTAMQSGRAKTNQWVLEHISQDAKRPDPFMGYTSCVDTKTQIRLNFDTLEDAKEYAKREGIAYQVLKSKERKISTVSYADNFKFGRLTPWTH